MSKRHLYLVCYDIADDKRLKQALKLTRQYATGGQKSVHECHLNSHEKTAIKEDFEALIHPTDDGVLILRLDPRQETHVLGQGIITTDHDWFYLG